MKLTTCSNMRAGTAMAASVLAVAATVFGQAQAAEPNPMAGGKLLCDLQNGPLVPIANQPGAAMMTQVGDCRDEQAPRFRAQWTSHLQFDDKGVGSLVGGLGTATLDGKQVGTYELTGGQYILEMKEGKVVGWRAHGASYWTSGELSGRSMAWTAGPTGETTSWISHASR